ncbi:MAG: MiaB/RimO family radical SAM methylthiotransferase, partial [Clostridia bacterium]|nr:MiaB/RimO family radical SAM methylthiotransferase [Clostridia bacterium]
MTRIAFVTLGCKTNQFETQAMEIAAREAGCEVVPAEEKADIYIVNTCAVTSNAGKKSRQEMRAAKKRNPDAVIAVCGCYSLLAAEELLKSGDADLAGGNRDHRAFLDACLAYQKKTPLLLPTDENAPFERLPAGNVAGRTRSLLKIEDGCSNFCAYCIIHYLRGRVRSEDPDFLAEETRRLSRAGAREIVVTGIEIASYGEDLPGKPTLADLLEKLDAASEGARIRLGSLEPRIVTPDFCRRLEKLDSLCPHFHLSLQSGSDTVLKRMGRRYDSALFSRSVALLRERFPHAAITTDVITGFPGETEEEFEALKSFVEEARFDRLGVFPYSREEGTPAYS